MPHEILHLAFGELTQTADQTLFRDIPDTCDAFVQVFFNGHFHAGFHDFFIDGCPFLQEEPAVEHVSACDFGPVKEGAQFVGEHIFLHHNAHLETEIVPDFIVIVVKSV